MYRNSEEVLAKLVTSHHRPLAIQFIASDKGTVLHDYTAAREASSFTAIPDQLGGQAHWLTKVIATSDYKYDVSNDSEHGFIRPDDPRTGKIHTVSDCLNCRYFGWPAQRSLGCWHLFYRISGMDDGD
jgi:hypothetical protein